MCCLRAQYPIDSDPDLYDALDDWGFDGFVIGDDAAIIDLGNNNLVASDTAC